MRNILVLFILTGALICALFTGCSAGNDVAEVTNATPNIDTLTLQEFKEMSSEEQMKIVELFETTEEYAKWFNALVEKSNSNLEQEKNTIDVIEENTTAEITRSTSASDEMVDTTNF